MRRATVRLVLAGCLVNAATPFTCAAADPASGAYWHDGKAELDGYRLTVDRYGHKLFLPASDYRPSVFRRTARGAPRRLPGDPIRSGTCRGTEMTARLWEPAGIASPALEDPVQGDHDLTRSSSASRRPSRATVR